MRRERMFGLLALAIVMISALGVPQGYAKGSSASPVKSVIQAIRSVSNPSAGCGNLELTELFGEVEMASNGRLIVVLENAHSSSSYAVSVDAQGTCDGSWQSVGSINTDQAGNGQLVQNLKLNSGHSYVFEFTDAQGNLVYATPYLTL